MNAPLGPAAIELKDIRKTFNRGTLAVEVLHGVSLRIEAGEFVAIVGSSGSGKTTLMIILGCRDQPNSGPYLFAGEDDAGFDRDRLAGQIRRPHACTPVPNAPHVFLLLP